MRLVASNKWSFKKKPSKIKKKCFCSKYKNAELKHITRWFEKISKTERIEGYESMSKERLISSINELAKKVKE